MKGLANNSLEKVYQWGLNRIIENHERREAKAIIRILLEDLLGITRQQMVLNPQLALSESEILKIHSAIIKLDSGMPVQYITGVAFFADLKLKTNEKALIPRPETEELCLMVSSYIGGNESKVLDIGTGSGCIALAIKSHSPGALVSACDVSIDALELAKQNASSCGLNIDFFELDILSDEPDESFDVIVSNPPYIPKSESAIMAPSVVDYEPLRALFVPDDDALVFYKRIFELCQKTLHVGGAVYLECHEDKAIEVAQIFSDSRKFTIVEILLDLQGKNRFVRALGYLERN